MAIEPVTREERFLAAAGGRSVTPPAPITRKEQLLQGIIDAVKSGGATPDVIEGAVNDYLNANPVKPGATTEQAAQIEQNKNDIADLQTEVDELKESGGNGSGQNPSQGGLTTAQIDALDWMLKVSAYKKGAPYAAAYAAFCRAFGLPDPDSGDTDETLTSISATYSGGAVPVGTAVSGLIGVTVTAHYSDGTSETVTGYTLSGSIAEGSNTITVTYQGQITTFTVTGVADSGGEETGGSGESTWTDGVAYVWENVAGSYVDNNNGAFVAYNGWSRSPYLACAGAEILRAEVVEQSTSMSRDNSRYNAFYDAERRFISAFTSVDTDAPAVGTYTDIAVPANAAFFVVSHKDNVMGASTAGIPYIRLIPYREVPV